MNQLVMQEWAIIKPSVDVVTKRIAESQMSIEKRKELSMMFLGHALGVACTFARAAEPALGSLPLSEIAEGIMKVVIPMLDPAKEKLQN